MFYFSGTAVATPSGWGTASVSPSTTVSARGEHWNSTSATTTAISFSATANTGYQFYGWSQTPDGAIVSTDNPYTPTLTSTSSNGASPTNTTLYARFVSSHNITLIPSESSPSNDCYLEADHTSGFMGDEILIIPHFPVGYEITSISAVNNSTNQAVPVTPASNLYRFTMPDADVTVTATFDIVSYTITCTTPEHGTLSTSPASSAHYGDVIEITATPDAGYTLKSLNCQYYGGDHYQPIFFDPPYTFSMPDDDVTVIAVFESNSNLNIQNGVQDVTDTPITFCDSDADPDGGWYVHYEDYTIHFLPQTPGKGVKIDFDSLFINNDTLYFYDGDISDDNLIAKLSCNEYHAFDHGTGLASVFGIDETCKVTVMSHSFMTVRFVSDYHWRELGWRATVTQAVFTPQPPAVAMEACDDHVFHLLGTSKGYAETKFYYSYAGGGATPGDNFTEATTLANNYNPTDYEIVVPSATTFPITFKVKTMVKDSDSGEWVSSAVETIVFGTAAELGKPVEPTITVNPNSSTLTIEALRPAINDTYHIYYTLDGSTPDNSSTELPVERIENSNGTTLYSGTLDLTEFCTVKAITTGTTCPNIASTVTEQNFESGTIYLLAPEISFAPIGNGATATTTITPSTMNCEIRYKINGGTTVIYNQPFEANANDRVTAWVTKANEITGQNYIQSPEAEKTYLPGNDTPGSANSGTYGVVVYLDDRENHNWSYYTDDILPELMRSLNPADVKITYFGNGTGTVSTTNGTSPANDSWTANASGVQVSPTESENTFAYFKTLERTDGSTASNPTGRCAYTTIPNPFTVRPTYGTNNSRWRGFYVWRIKRISGGKIYTAATGGTEQTAYTSGNLATTNILNADQTYYFAPDGEYGMEVELEALWARAYVSTSTTSLTTYVTGTNAYERNFHVVTSAQNASSYQKSYGLTVSSRYPDGTNGGGSVSGGFTAAGYTKFENIEITGATGSTWTANGNNFVIGRGVNGAVNLFTGINGNISNPNYAIRLESGAFNYVSLLNGYGNNSGGSTAGNQISGSLNAQLTFGNDYDRATNSVNGPNVSYNFCCGYSNTRQNPNGNNMVVRVKSGQIGSSWDMSSDSYVANMEQTLYMGIAGNTSWVTGNRKLYIEGGVLASIAGGIDGGNQSGSQSVTLRMTGGHVRGAIYGAGARSAAYGNRVFVFTGGDVIGWIGGGCNGEAGSGTTYVGTTNGESFIYFGGKTISGGAGSNVDINGSTGGIVFGAGKGISSSTSIGEMVEGTNVVIADECDIEHYVYGGGNYGFASDHSNIYILGGTVHDAVFGGSNQNNGPDITITMKGGKVLGEIYGGSNSNGIIQGDINIDASGGTVGHMESGTLYGGSIYGGGLGINTDVYGNVNITLSGEANALGNIYGGGEMGSVLGNSGNGGVATVNIYGGTVGHSTVDEDPYSGNVYGAGKGNVGNAYANLTFVRETMVNITDGHVYGAVFGGGENGHVSTNTTVTISGGQIGDERTTCHNKYHGNVYGGGRGIDTDNSGNYSPTAGNVAGNVTVNILAGARIMRNVYGGGNMASVGTVNGTDSYGWAVPVEGTGLATINISGGLIGSDGLNDTVWTDNTHTSYTRILENGHVFGSSHGRAGDAYKDLARVNNTRINISGNAFIRGSVFGGGEDGHVLGSTNIFIEGGTVGSPLTEEENEVNEYGTGKLIYRGSVYGGGRGIDLDSDGHFSPTAGFVRKNTTIVMNDGFVRHNVYGGGSMASVGEANDTESGLATVKINGGQVGSAGNNGGHVFGSGRGLANPDYANLSFVKNTLVEISGAAHVFGSVFGGGENAHVRLTTTVNINGGAIGRDHEDFQFKGNVYGGGRGLDRYGAQHNAISPTAGRVYEQTEVNVSNGLIYRSVYGGGSMASVGDKEDDSYLGQATVNITGGQIGTTGGENGNVFGSSKGMAGKIYKDLAYVRNAYVNIKPNANNIKGSVFGGGEDGHVLENTYVTMTGGIVGRTFTDQELTDQSIYCGNVYGGGRGIDTDSEGHLSSTAGLVKGNTFVSITGGHVLRNVYGGGSLASVGDPDEQPQNGTYSTGLATVSITGGQIGTDGGKGANNYEANPPTCDHRKENGFVYGSGRGVAGDVNSQYIHLAFVKNTSVSIGGTAYVTGSVFGGGENGHVRMNTNVNVIPGEGYSHEIATGDAEPYPVIGYPLSADDPTTTEIDENEMVENLEKPRIIYRGNVYGGGRGIDHLSSGNLSRTAGVVNGNTTVSISGGTVRHDVYGGGSMASVGTYSYDGSGNVTGVTTGTGLSTVAISGGKIGMDTTLLRTQVYRNDSLIHNLSGINNGQVFGGGRGESGDLYKNLAFVNNTNVEISGGTIYGAVFGGGCNGHVEHDTYVRMTAGTIGHSLTPLEKKTNFLHPEPIYFGNVYGGGRGIDHANLNGNISRTAGLVYGNTNVEISGGLVYHDVYGGGSLANVGTITYNDQNEVESIANGTGTATVTITGTAQIGTDGQNAGYVYGSGRGMAGNVWSDMAFVKETAVTIGTENGSDTPSVRASVFGGGSNGHVYDSTLVKVYTGTIGTKLTIEEMAEYEPGAQIRPHIYRGNVYGGGRGVERDITSGQGVLSNTAGVVFGNTHVEVYGGQIYHNVYGGGSLANVGTVVYDNNGAVDTITQGGTATVIINGGKIGMDHSDYTNPPGDNTIHSGLNNGQVFGSGRGEAGTGYADHAYTKNTYVIVNGGNVYGAVFGGGANGHVRQDTHVTINDGVIGVNDESTGMSLFSVYRGNVYGGGRGIDTDPQDTHHFISKTAGQVRRDTYVEVNGGTIYHNVYGGGSLANVGEAVYDNNGDFVEVTYGGDTHVTISGTAQIGLMDDPNVPNGPGYNNGHVFGAGRGKPGVDEFGNDYTQLTYVKNTHVTIEGGLIRGSVFGSGDNGHVYKDTEVNVTGGQIGEDAGPNQGNVFGGGRGLDTYRSEPKLSPTAAMVYGNTNVTVSGGTVMSNVYGGGNVASVGTFDFTLDSNGQVTAVALADNKTGNTNVLITGTATVGDGTDGYGYVFGACRGLLAEPFFSKVKNTNVTINAEAGSIQSNIYGGGEIGEVMDSTNVIINSGTLHEVYGAGQGVANEANGRANIRSLTMVTVNNGIINNIYGGGQNGTVRYSGAKTEPPVASVVTINSGTIRENVFGGGDQGTTEGRVIVNMNNGTIQGELFGGAKGTRGSVYVAGLKTVNMRGGTVYNHVYGGSRNANDGFALTDTVTSYTNGTKYNTFVNISGGMVRGNVYGAGFFGYMFGSSDVNIGKDAILYANSYNIDRGTHNVNILRIIMNVFAGSNWGDYDPDAGFGSSTTTGRSNIYVDGRGYNTVTINGMESGYMSIDGSIYGSGTSSDAGTTGRKIQVANYGKAVLGNQSMEPFGSRDVVPNVVLGASRYVQSIQRCDTLILDNSSIVFTGQGDISQNQNTVEYSLVFIQKGLFVRNGSNIVSNMQIDETRSVFSQYRPDYNPITNDTNSIYVKDPFTYWIGVGDSDHNFYYDCGSGGTPTLLVDDSTDPTITNINTFRFNGGYSMFVRYKYKYQNGEISFADHGSYIFGELNGFFRMVTETGNETFAHARPKITDKGNGNDNWADGGFLSYYNGGNTPTNGHNTFVSPGNGAAAYTGGEQFPYLNVLSSSGKGDRTDYRYWRIREAGSSNVVTTPVALFIYSHPNDNDQFLEIHADIELSTPECTDSRYVLSDIDFGDNAHLVDAAIFNPDTTSSNYYIVNSGAHDNHYHEVFLNKAGTNHTWASSVDTLAREQDKIMGHPNTHFGLVISPNGCLANNGNKSYLISENSKGYLAGDAYFDYPDNPNGQLPGISLRLTYNKELTMSAALAPVIIQFERYCGNNPDPEDIINIPLYITTQTELGQNINMTSYLMYGDLATLNAKESYTVKATLPPFDPYEAELTGVDIPFYIYGQSYANSTDNASAAIPTFDTYTTSAFDENDHHMAFTYQIALNSDNKSGWRESIPLSLPHDISLGSTTPVLIGSADGRNPFSIDFKVYYNSCKEVKTNGVSNMIYKKNDIIGTTTFKVCYPITAEELNKALNGNFPSDVEHTSGWKTFNILVNIFKRDNSLGFYVDGVRGDNNYTGEYANYGLRTMQGVIDHGWKPGDKVYVVRPINLPNNTLIWSSESLGATMTLYRYPGADIDPTHAATTDSVSPYVRNGLFNPVENTGYYQQNETTVINDGAIFANVRGKGNLMLNGIILDGMNGDQSLYPWCPDGYDLANHQNQQVPLIKVGNGGKVTLTQGSAVRYSNIKSANPHGSAILVENGGTLDLSNNVTITNNTFPSGSTGQGAGVYLEEGGTMIVGGSVNITGNKNASGRENNVFLSTMNCEITIDQDNELSKDAKIGVTKYNFYPSDTAYLSAHGIDPELYDLSPIATSIFPERIKEAFRNDNFLDDTERAYTHYYVTNTLYFGKTWAHFVTNDELYDETLNPEGIESGSFTVDGEGNVTVTSSRAFAYLISYINGLNDVDEKHPNAKVRIASNVDVHEHYWKPIIGFTGTFDGQWYNIDGITVKREGFRSIGMFDNVIGGGVVKNTYIRSSDIQPWNPEDTGELEDIEQFAGSIAGTVDDGGVVTECQVSGTIIASAESANRFTYIGGAVGHIKNGGVVHSVIGTANLTGFTMGGIVGRVESGGSLFNSYSNTHSITTLSLGNDYSGGLAGHVKAGGYVENCYVKLQCTKPDYFGWFVGKNEGTVSYCYAPENEATYVFNSVGATLSGHGNYGSVKELKEIGYLYDDNKVTLTAGNNDYHSNTITYASGKIDKWPGMVSALNQWVTANPHSIANLTPWLRPNTPQINQDLPVLAMIDNKSLSTIDVNTLRYDTSLDGTLTYCNANDTIDSYVFFYGIDDNVTKTPDANVNVFVNEDAVLIQKASGGKADPDPFNATVGVTFDNSGTSATDYFSHDMDYDWHLMSTPLSNASMGTTYNMAANMAYGARPNLISMTDGYFPNGLKVMSSTDEDVKWDFYCYDEPDYHWINFKRSTDNHWHIDTINDVPHPPVHYSGLNNLGPYSNEDNFKPGKGYMMAISQDSYLSNSGTLNSGDVKIQLTAMAPDGNQAGYPKLTYDKGSNLVGNPYQAYLDLEKITEADNTLTDFYIYDADQDAYAPYTGSASANPHIPSQYIHPHQGFFVLTNTTKDLTFTTAMTTTSSDPTSYYRSDKINYPLVNLFVFDTVGNRDLTIIEFKRPELGGVRKVNNLRNADFKLNAHYEDEDYALLFTPDNAKGVPVFFKTPHDGKYTLYWDLLHGTFTSLFLVDNLTGARCDMLQNNHYDFNALSTDYASRFYIVFNVTDVEEYNDDVDNNDFAFFNGIGWVVEGQGQLELIDMLGHVLYANNLSGEPTIVHFDDFAAGVYMLRLVDGKRILKTQKIVIK